MRDDSQENLKAMNMAGISHAGASWMERSFGNNVSLLRVSQGSQPESGPGRITWRGKSRQASLKVLKTRFHA